MKLFVARAILFAFAALLVGLVGLGIWSEPFLLIIIGFAALPWALAWAWNTVMDEDN